MTPADKLLAAYLDDALTPPQRIELIAWLKADPANLRRFVETGIREEQLRQAVLGRGHLQSRVEARGVALIAAPEARGDVLPRVRVPWRSAGWLAAAAAVVLLAAVPAVNWLSPQRVDVTVVAADGARLEGHAGLMSAGARLALRQWRLAAGTLRLQLPNGVRLDVAGPAEARFESPWRLRAVRGRFTADVGATGKGFTIETDQARIVDLGTRFGIDIGPGGTTDVVVFEGQVEVYSSVTRQRPAALIARLDAGEGVRVDRTHSPHRVVFITQGAGPADWTVQPAPPPGAVIAHVADNLGLTESRRFYRVSAGGMTPGVPARHMQRARWYPYDEGTPLPPWLEGADLIETFGVDKSAEEFALTVTLAQPALLCVFQDSRVPPPTWLREQFVPSGFRLEIRRLPGDERYPGVEPVADVPFEVWTREVPEAGKFTLGPPRSPAAGDRGRMYGVAASPLAPHSAR